MIEKLIKFSQKFNQELVILPHRRDTAKRHQSYKYFENVLLYDVNFEIFYFINSFENCSFVTLYSTAILYVEEEFERYFVTNVFEPKFNKTFSEKIFFIKRPGINEANEYFLKNNIKKINYDSL